MSGNMEGAIRPTQLPSEPLPLSASEIAEAERLREAQVVRESARSLEAYLANVVIDCRPDPLPWNEVIEDWQVGLVRQIIPAIEAMAGIRKDYKGPRKFWFGLSKGHDKTGLIGRLCNWALGFAKHYIKAIACAGDKEQAGLILDSINAECRLNPWLDEIIQRKGVSAVGPGGELSIMSSDAPTASGEKPDLIICDEVTFWKKRDLWDMVFAAAEKRPGCVFIVITNAGIKGSWQDDIRQMAREDREDWIFYESPQYQTLASWMTKSAIDKLRKGLAKGFAKRVIDNVWIDSTENPLLTEELIIPCESPDTLWPTYYTRFGYSPELYVGIDVGRTKDLTVCWTLELLDDDDEQFDDEGFPVPPERRQKLAWTREILILKNLSFARQKQILRTRITRNVVKCNIDKGAVGYQLGEELEQEFPRVVEGVALGAGVQGKIALLMKTYFESRRIRIPSDNVLRGDLQQVSEVETGTGGLPIIRTERTDTGHADRFWALGLALAGLPVETGPRYHRAPRTAKSRYAAVIR